MFYSSDARARVSTGGFGNEDPYADDVYDSSPDDLYTNAEPKGYSVIEDSAININFDVGTLVPGASQTISYYTSLDNRDFSDVLKDIQSNEGGTNIPNNGDANGDGIQDDTQTDVAGLFSSVTNKYIALQAGTNCTIHNLRTSSEAHQTLQDGGYSYPDGLMKFTLQGCGAPGFTTHIVQYYYDIAGSGFRVRKYNAATKKYATVSGATITHVTIGGHHVIKVAYNLTDGGTNDEDGSVNGQIVDPVGLALQAIGSPNTGYGQPVSATPIAVALSFLALISVAIGMVLSYQQRKV